MPSAATFYRQITRRERGTRAAAEIRGKAGRQASADQSELSAIRTVTREAAQPICAVYQGCDNIGSAPRDEAFARSSDTSESFSCAVRRAVTRPRNRDALLTLGGFVALGLVAAKRLRKKK